MKRFDVVIIGAGPAGGQCARKLTQAGQQVLLVEQHETFSKNDFSSAATPLETLEKFNLPETVVGSFWQNLVIVTTNVNQKWQSPTPLGAVLDFAKLREFLATEVTNQGGEVWMGYRYIKHFQENQNTIVELKQRSTGKIISVETQVLVDGTGPTRAVMYAKKAPQPNYLTGTGIEYLIELSQNDYQKYSQDLIFFLGHRWMPRGYSWIFPMGNNRLKVGSAQLNRSHEWVNQTQTLRSYLELLLTDYLTEIPYKIINHHGGMLKYCSGLEDIYYQDNIIAIGDAVSMVNMLGGEGIRHGMENANIAAGYIQDYLSGKITNFAEYRQEIKQTYTQTWNWSEQMGLSKYLQYSDQSIDKGVYYLKDLSLEDMMAILFDYDFKRLYKAGFKYLCYKISGIWTRLKLKFNLT
ncbi:NAD(P)/FAD-dependent oxidoreductase [Planktothrix agardhii]|uniref:NAD(P)/FAD-dependent oxidoreductase n=1 Tax=Planktothrix agardhii TaxID=1160 RepID=UPI0004035114|nr:NAD(P)/FAD-dependent oxidoreductase [Planktothrix agardhii]